MHINRLCCRCLSIFPALVIMFASQDLAAAEYMVIRWGAYKESLPVAELREFSQTGQPVGKFGEMIRQSKSTISYQEIADKLRQKVYLDLAYWSTFLNSKEGVEAILKPAINIIRSSARYDDDNISMLSLRAAIIKSIVENEGYVSALSIYENYPEEGFAINAKYIIDMHKIKVFAARKKYAVKLNESEADIAVEKILDAMGFGLPLIPPK